MPHNYPSSTAEEVLNGSWSGGGGSAGSPLYVSQNYKKKTTTTTDTVETNCPHPTPALTYQTQPTSKQLRLV